MLVERLRAQWRVREAQGNVRETPVFEAGGVVLGAGTWLAKAGNEESSARLEALLSTAYRRRIDPHALGHIKAATSHWNKGERDRAILHLALARLGRLTNPAEDARRLFMADGLMKAGAAPELILEVLDDQAALKYSPDQPRVPAGNGRPSGRWSSAGAGGGAAKPAQQIRTVTARPPAARPSAARQAAPVRPATARANMGVAGAAVAIGRPAGLDLAGLSQRGLASLAEFAMGAVDAGALGTAATAGGAAAAFGIVFIPSKGPQGQWVKVGGPGDISYYHNPDEVGFKFRFTTSDGVVRTINAAPDPNGDFRGPDGRLIGRLVKAAGKIGVVIATGELLDQDTYDPKLCPKPVRENHGVKGRVYEDFNKLDFNPGNPTPSGFGYRLRGPGIEPNPTYDDCQQKTGALGEYKGPGYAKLLFGNPYVAASTLYKLEKQAEAQDLAKGARPLTWRFEEQSVADFMRKYFRDHNLDIRVEWRPMPGDQ